MFSAGLVLIVLSVAIGAVAFFVYNWQVLRGTSTPNATSWFIWMSLGIVSASSYLFMTKSLAKSAMVIEDALLCASVFFFALYLRKFADFNWLDGVVLGGSAVSALVWYVFGSPDWTNLLTQTIAFTSFLPIVAGVHSGRMTEKETAWLLWSLAYGLTGVYTLLHYDGNWHNLVSPLFIGTFMHGLVGGLAWFKNQQAA